jgi:histidyl-tRNA synthetase
MKSIIQSLKGTRDFFPEDMAVRSWLYRAIRSVSESYGYQEYEGPFLEKIELYAAKSGDELVKEQAFVFPDRGGDLITLRPELTPTLARMVAQRQNELAYPLRWWSFGPFWRYEKPQKGRTREFFQWNIDLIGATSPEADAEMIAICASFFQKVGLSHNQVQILVNNRRLMDTKLDGMGIALELRKATTRLIDRIDKMQPAEWDANALEMGLTPAQVERIRELLGQADAWQDSDELRRMFAALDVMGLKDYVRFDAHIIRGLDYYTGTVFEAVDRDGGRAILGGGRYDNLVGDVGGDPLPGVGFAMGDVMISLVLQKYNCVPEMPTAPARVFVTVFDEQHLTRAMGIAADLRRAGINTMCYPESAKLPRQFKLADKLGARFAIIEGPDEESRGQVVVKDLSSRTQAAVARIELVDYLRALLAQAPGL